MAVIFPGTVILFQHCGNGVTIRHGFSYPLPVPDSAALPFLPGVVTTDSLDFNAAFSPEGKRFFFSRSRSGKWLIYMTELKGESWTRPVPAAFNEYQYSQADPFIANDGTLYYISNKPRDKSDSIPDFDIWFVKPLTDSTWSIPENLRTVNSDSTEYYVSLAKNGNLYFASDRAGTAGSLDIYVSEFKEGVYTEPTNLGPSINSSHTEHDPMISSGEEFLIFTAVDRPDSFGSADLYYSERMDDGSWTQAVNMGKTFNTETYEYCSYITRDNQYLFFSSELDVKWISTRHIPWFKKLQDTGLRTEVRP